MSTASATLGKDLGASVFGPVGQIEAGLLDVGYVDAGPLDGPAVLLLHGWPYDIHSYAEVTPRLTAAGFRVIIPYLRGYGSTRFLSGDTRRNGQQAALAEDVIALMDALSIEKAIVGGFDWGARTACILAAIWPERCHALVAVSGYLIGSPEANRNPLPPRAEFAWWYQFYFASDRGQAGYELYRRDFAELIWRTASPNWDFAGDAFDRTAASFDNPDHVSIVIHNYRWRMGIADGEARYDEVEARLADAPVITVPTITLEGDANGAPHPDPLAYRTKFSGRYSHRLVAGGVGHNLPQEAPGAFADAILDAMAPVLERRGDTADHGRRTGTNRPRRCLLARVSDRRHADGPPQPTDLPSPAKRASMPAVCRSLSRCRPPDHETCRQTPGPPEPCDLRRMLHVHFPETRWSGGGVLHALRRHPGIDRHRGSYVRIGVSRPARSLLYRRMHRGLQVQRDGRQVRR